MTLIVTILVIICNRIFNKINPKVHDILRDMSNVSSYKIIKTNGTGEIVEKKSRFIASAFYVENQQQAEEKIAEISKKYWDAKHNCYAYVIGVNSETTKCSDNGEPSLLHIFRHN